MQDSPEAKKAVAETAGRTLAAIMFTDMVGYSALTQKNEALALELLETHHKLLRPIFPKYDGKEIKTIGDAFLVEFRSALEAAHCAIELQRTLVTHNASAPPQQRIQIRIGIHVGDVVHQNADVFGDAVNIASRIEPQAHPGGICVSEDVARQIQNKIEEPLRRIGKSNLKNIQLPVEVYEVVLPWIGKDEIPGQPSSSAPAPAIPVRAGGRQQELDRKPIRALAVLPLANFSRDPEQEYFADGMTEALIADLAKLRALKIISRTSAMRYKGTDKSLPEIAKELNVDAVVEGSVLRAGQRVRITAQLIHAATDTHLWAENYERDLHDVLVLQSEVARAIAREIQVAVTPEETKLLASARPVNPEAYEAYLKGRFHWYQLSPENIDTALEYFHLALEKDPKYALAYAGIAEAWGARGYLGFMPAREALPKAQAAVLKAIELNDTLAEAHDMLARYRTLYEWDWAGAEREYRWAIQLNPNYADVRVFYSLFLNLMRRPEEAMGEMERALELDPLNFFFQHVLGCLWLDLGRYDDAIAQFRKALRTEPNFPLPHLRLWALFHEKRMYEEALAEARKYFVALGDQETVEALARGYAEAGYSGAMRLGAEKLAARSSRTYVPPILIARLYAHSGENDRALEWLEKAYEGRDTYLLARSPDREWEGLRDDPRFQDLLRRIGLPS